MTSVSGLALYTPKYTRYNQNYNYTPVNNVQKAAATKEAVDELVVENGEKCTDGKDDGKIGFFSKLFNAAKGIVKTVANGVKGMFTDSEGHFSLGKTLLSVATTAACIAFPAVGLVACGIGAVVGGVQVINGISKASQAKTDAEAKEAWQNIGGGGFTVAMSVVGAKAGLKAVGKTSTATNGLTSLDKNATLGQKAVALGKDMWSSTKNSAINIKNSVGLAHDMNKATRLRAQASKASDPTKAEALWEQVDALDAKYFSASPTTQTNAEALVSAKSAINQATRHPLQTLGKTKVGQTLRHPVNAARATAQTINENGGLRAVVSQNIRYIPTRLQTVAKVITTEGKNAAIKQFGYDTVAEVLQYAIPTQLNLQG